MSKRDEYLRAGIRIYVIVDPLSGCILRLLRHGDSWQEQKLESGTELTLPPLPGFADVFSPVA